MPGMFTPGCHVAVEDFHHTLGHCELTFLASVFASSSCRVVTKKGLLRSLPLLSQNLHLCRNTPTFIALITDLRKGEIITELLSVCDVTFRVRGERQGESITMTVASNSG